MKNRLLFRTLSSLLILTAACAPASFALAEDTQATPSPRAAFSISGQVVAGESLSLTAPYGGKLLDYTARAGDVAQPGETPFSIETTKLYAPCDGVVGGVRARPGDEAAFVQEQYGALLFIEPATLLKIDTSTSEAYDKNENKLVHVGETVYLQSNNSKSRTGAGYVTQVDGSRFSVEITQGNLSVDERASIFRNPNYEGASRIGIGKTARFNPVAITGEGSVLRVLVAEGQAVRRGDALAEMVNGVLPGYSAALPEAAIPCLSIVSSIAAQPGEQVSAGQVLATLHPVESLQVMADLNELDLERIQVGDAVRVELTGLKESGLLEGTVASISSLSSTDSGDAEYKVYVDFPVGSAVREGMSATVYLNER